MLKPVLVILGAAAAKVLLTLGLELTSVETYLWVCAQRPALGYFDYPGMAPWLIALSTALAGDSPLGVRLFTIACGAGTAWMILLAARRLYDERTAALAGTLAALLPLFFGHGAFASPDAPLLFFWSAAFWALATALSGGPRGAWILGGFLAGLAMESKYQAVFLPLGILGFLAASPEHRGWLARRDPYLAALAALAAFAPAVAWNASHGWESFAYQGVSRFAEQGFRAKELIDFPLSQLILLTPAAAVLAWLAGGRTLARWRSTPWQDRLCAALGMPLLIFFAGVLFLRPVRSHWPAPAYLTLTVLAAATASRGGRRALEWTAWIAGVALLLGTAALPFVPRERVSGWATLAGEVERERPEFLIGREYHLASQMSYHLRPLPAVEFTALGRPSKAFPHWWRGRDFLGKSAVLVSDPRHLAGDRSLLESHFERVGPAREVDVPRFFGAERFVLIRAEGYRPP